MAFSNQNSEYYISVIKNKYGDNLEGLSIKDRYGLIALLAMSINWQTYPLRIYTQEESWFEKMLSREASATIDHCPVLAMPNVLKFLSESIPDKW